MNSFIKILLATVLGLLAAAAFAAVDVNKATQADLETVAGVGPAMSTRILDERKKSTFQNWGDLIDRVKGVGPGNASKFSNGGLTVNGAAFKAEAAPATPASKKAVQAPAKGDKTPAMTAKNKADDAPTK